MKLKNETVMKHFNLAVNAVSSLNIENFFAPHASTNMTGKMTGKMALSTSPLLNPVCKSRQATPGTVCENCYSFASQWMGGLRKNLAENFAVMNARELNVYEIATLPFWGQRSVRFEAFGDVASVICAVNYCRIAQYFKSVTFTAWTKNPNYWRIAFDIVGGKPSNLILGYSSPVVGVVDYPMIEKFASILDFAFTVYGSEEDYNNAKGQVCAGINCCMCDHCYNSENIANNPVKFAGVALVKELLR